MFTRAKFQYKESIIVNNQPAIKFVYNYGEVNGN